MSDNQTHNLESPTESPAQTLNGAWFRRERERVAIGRKTLAARLATTESRLHTLEWRRQPVPSEWIAVLRTLEFRIPEDLNLPSSIPIEVCEPTPAIQSAIVTPVPTPVPTPIPTPAVAQSQPVDAATLAPEIEPALAESATTPAAALFHGHWLRERREQKKWEPQNLSQKLKVTESDLQLLERHDIQLPLRWIPRLLKLGLLLLEEVKTASKLPATSRHDGIWLQRKRRALRLTTHELAVHCHASTKDVELVESHVWPVPKAWLPILAALHSGRSGAPALPTDSPELRSSTIAKPMSIPKTPPRKAEPTKPAAQALRTDHPLAVLSQPVPTEHRAPTANRLDTIVEYRLQLGQQTGQPVLDALIMIAQDLRLTKKLDKLSYDTLAAALKVLLRPTQ